MLIFQGYVVGTMGWKINFPKFNFVDQIIAACSVIPAHVCRKALGPGPAGDNSISNIFLVLNRRENLAEFPNQIWFKTSTYYILIVESCTLPRGLI